MVYAYIDSFDHTIFSTFMDVMLREPLWVACEVIGGVRKSK